MHAFIESLIAAYLLGIITAVALYYAATAIEARARGRRRRRWQRVPGATSSRPLNIVITGDTAALERGLRRAARAATRTGEAIR